MNKLSLLFMFLISPAVFSEDNGACYVIYSTGKKNSEQTECHANKTKQQCEELVRQIMWLMEKKLKGQDYILKATHKWFRNTECRTL